jgi:putative transposase
MDASFFKMHPGSPVEPILAAWGSPPTASRSCRPGARLWGVNRRLADFVSDLREQGLSRPPGN